MSGIWMTLVGTVSFCKGRVLAYCLLFRVVTAVFIEPPRAEARSFYRCRGLWCVLFGLSVYGDDAVHHHVAMMERGMR